MNSIDDFIDNTSGENQRSMLRHLRKLMHQASPQMREKIRYRIPFFGCPRWFCYFNPRKTGGLELCFLQGNALSNEHHLLESQGRKTISGVILTDMADLLGKEEALLELIHEAIMVEENRVS